MSATNRCMVCTWGSARSDVARREAHLAHGREDDAGQLVGECTDDLGNLEHPLSVPDRGAAELHNNGDLEVEGRGCRHAGAGNRPNGPRCTWGLWAPGIEILGMANVLRSASGAAIAWAMVMVGWLRARRRADLWIEVRRFGLYKQPFPQRIAIFNTHVSIDPLMHHISAVDPASTTGRGPTCDRTCWAHVQS